MKKIKSIFLFSLSFVIAFSFFAKKIDASSVNVTSNPLGVASTFKYFATGNVTFDNSVGDINSRIAANTVNFNQPTWFNIQGNPVFESDATLTSPALVLNEITSDNQTLLRGIGTANSSFRYIADTVSLPTNASVSNDSGAFFNKGMLSNVSSRKYSQSVGDYFSSLSSGVTSFSAAKTQLKNISTEYATNTENSDASVSSNIQSDGSERFDVILSSKSSSTSVIYLNVSPSATGISIHINNSSTSNLPYIIVNWSNRTNFSWSDKNSYSVSGTTGSNQDWVSHIINNFPNATGSVSLNNGSPGEQFIGSIFAPYASSVTLGNYADNNNKVYNYISNVVSGGDINVNMLGAGNNNLIDSTDFPGTTPTISSVTFTNGSTSTAASSDGTTTIPITANADTKAYITSSNDLGSDYHTFVKVNDGNWQSFTNGQTAVSSLNNYNKALASSSVNSKSDRTTIGLNLQRSNKLTFAIAKTKDPTKVDASSPTTFTTTLDETGALTATIPTTTSIGSVALGSTTAVSSALQNITITNSFELPASLTASVDTTTNKNYYKAASITVDKTTTSLETNSKANIINMYMWNSNDGTVTSTSFTVNIALGNSVDAMKEVTPGQSYSISLNWSISYSGNGN